jgi:hypothetical protein
MSIVSQSAESCVSLEKRAKWVSSEHCAGRGIFWGADSGQAAS